MPSLLDWSAVHPQGGDAGPAPELASINGLLSALAERRMKNAQFEQEQKLEQEKLAQQQAHQAALEQYNRDTLEQTSHHQAAALEEQKSHNTAMLTEQRQIHVSAALEKAQAMAAAGDKEGARRLLLAAGASEDTPQPPPVQQQPAAPPPQAPPAPPGRAAIEPPPFVPQSPGVFPGPAAAPAPPPQAAPPQQAPAPMPTPAAAPGMQFRMPAGGVLDLGNAEADRTARAKRQAAEFVKQVSPHIRGGYAKRALDETAGMMLAPTWDPNEDPHRFLAERTHQLEQEGIERERIGEGRRATDDNKALTRNQRGLNVVQQTLKQFDNLENMKRLGSEYDRIKDAAEKLHGPAPSQRAAVDSFIASAKNGTVTKQSLEYMARNMSGGMGQLESMIERLKSGDYGKQDLQAMAQSIDIGEQAIRHDVERKRQAFVAKMYTKPFYAYKGNVDTEYAGRFGPFGYAVEDREGDTPFVDPTGERGSIPGVPGSAKKKTDSKQALLDLAARLDALQKGGGQ